jgi:hypothetical protein
MPARDASADLSLRDAAKALGLSAGTVRAYVKAGKLQAATVTGKFGPEYRLRPAVVADYGRRYLGLDLDADALARGTKGQAGAAVDEDVRQLYERLLTATAEATRYKALAELTESTKAEAERHYQAMIAELQHERDAAQEKADAAEEAAAGERAKAEEVAAELARVKSRGFLARVFGGAG